MSDPTASVDAVSKAKRAQWAIFRPGDSVVFTGDHWHQSTEVAAVDSRAGYPVMITDRSGRVHMSDSAETVVLSRRLMKQAVEELDLDPRWLLSAVYGEPGENPTFELRDDRFGVTRDPDTFRVVYEWDGPELNIDVTRWLDRDDLCDMGSWRYTVEGLEFTRGDHTSLGDEEAVIRKVGSWIWNLE